MKRHNTISSAMAFEPDVWHTFCATQVYYENSKFYKECMGLLAILLPRSSRVFEYQLDIMSFNVIIISLS